MRFIKYFSILLVMGFGMIPSSTIGDFRKVTIVQPKHNEVFRNPIKICMEVEGMVFEDAKNGMREGYGHHHILFSSLPPT